MQTLSRVRPSASGASTKVAFDQPRLAWNRLHGLVWPHVHNSARVTHVLESECESPYPAQLGFLRRLQSLDNCLLTSVFYSNARPGLFATQSTRSACGLSLSELASAAFASFAHLMRSHSARLISCLVLY